MWISVDEQEAQTRLIVSRSRAVVLLINLSRTEISLRSVTTFVDQATTSEKSTPLADIQLVQSSSRTTSGRLHL